MRSRTDHWLPVRHPINIASSTFSSLLSSSSRSEATGVNQVISSPPLLSPSNPFVDSSAFSLLSTHQLQSLLSSFPITHFLRSLLVTRINFLYQGIVRRMGGFEGRIACITNRDNFQPLFQSSLHLFPTPFHSSLSPSTDPVHCLSLIRFSPPFPLSCNTILSESCLSLLPRSTHYRILPALPPSFTPRAPPTFHASPSLPTAVLSL